MIYDSPNFCNYYVAICGPTSLRIVSFVHISIATNCENDMLAILVAYSDPKIFPLDSVLFPAWYKLEVRDAIYMVITLESMLKAEDYRTLRRSSVRRQTRPNKACVVILAFL